jgi:hypothetical protein
LRRFRHLRPLHPTPLSTLGLNSVHVVELPSIDPAAALKPNAYAADVVVVGFSYGGAVALPAADGLWHTGKKGGGRPA